MADTNKTRRFVEALERQREALRRAGLTEQEQDRAMQPAESFVATVDEEEAYRWYLARGYSEYEARDLVWGHEYTRGGQGERSSDQRAGRGGHSDRTVSAP